MISVIVVTYNQQATIARTLDSILRQECHEPIEIIIGEDHSTDGTLGICQSYAEQYPNIIRLLANDPNKGLLDNYYDCMLEAKGEYLADLAGDDEWSDPLKLEKEVSVLEQYSDVVLVHTDYKLRHARTGLLSSPQEKWWTGSIEKGIEITDGHEMTWHVLSQHQRPAIHLCTALWRRDVFLQVYEEYTKFFRNHTYKMEDTQLTTLICTRGRIAYLPESTLYYEYGRNTVSSNDNAEAQYAFEKSALLLIRDLAAELKLDSSLLQGIYEQKLYGLMKLSLRTADKQFSAETITLADILLTRHSNRISMVRFIADNPLLRHITLFVRRIARLLVRK